MQIHLLIPSVLWRCWLDGRKGIRPVKLSGGVLAWFSVCSEVQTRMWPSWCHCHSLSFASVKSRLVFTFLVPAHMGSPGQRAVKWVCVCANTLTYIIVRNKQDNPKCQRNDSVYNAYRFTRCSKTWKPTATRRQNPMLGTYRTRSATTKPTGKNRLDAGINGNTISTTLCSNNQHQIT